MASRKHAIEKTITWRIVATVSTFIMVWFYTGDLTIGLFAGAVDTVIKTVLFYMHERTWDKYDDRVDRMSKAYLLEVHVKIQSSQTISCRRRFYNLSLWRFGSRRICSA